MAQTFSIGNETSASRRAVTTAPVSEIIEVARQWAADFGWVDIARLAQPDRLVFKVSRYGPSAFYPQMEVAASVDHTHGSSATFTAVLDTRMWPGDIWSELERVAVAFADGVANELRRRGYDVSPSSLGGHGQNRAKLRRLEKFRRRATQVLLVAFVPLAAVAGVIGYRWHDLGIFSCVLIWLGWFGCVLALLRWRIIGMRARMLFWVVVFFLLLALILAPVSVLYR